MKKCILFKGITVLIIVILLTSAVFAASSTGTAEPETCIKDLGNGFTVESTVTVSDSDVLSRATSTKKATKSDVYKYNGTEIATIDLTATFGYDGSSAWVISSSVSKTISSGWSYNGERLTSSGGTAAVTATLRRLLIYSVAVDTSLTCSPTGSIC